MKKDKSYTQAFFRRGALRFDCTRCGKCCSGSPEEQVFLFPGEAERIRRHLSLSGAWFRRRYLDRYEGDPVLRLRDDGSCVFLGKDGCRIYRARPLQCRSYPFWPEIVKNRRNWQAEARACEGIGRGEPVDIQLIEDYLQQFVTALQQTQD